MNFSKRTLAETYRLAQAERLLRYCRETGILDAANVLTNDPGPFPEPLRASLRPEAVDYVAVAVVLRG